MNIKTTIIYTLAIISIWVGYVISQNYYLTPEHGMGYLMGVVGATMMLILLIYQLRKRYRSLKFLGPVTMWFRIHMTFGVMGPIFILYHSGFRLGSINSSVALFSMLAVACSGLVGRYLYNKIHKGLYGRQLTLEDVQRDAKAHHLSVRQAKRAVDRLHLFERLFSAWHVFHIPLYVMLIITAIVHIIAVHLY